MDWLRLWHEMPTDPKWRVIARKSSQPIPSVLSVYVFLLVNASGNAKERGRTQSWNSEDVAEALGIDEESVIAIIDAMQGKVLDGDKITGWSTRQPKREDDSAERARKWREQKKEQSVTAENERNRTQSNAGERPEERRVDKEEKKSSSSLSIPLLAPEDETRETAVREWVAQRFEFHPAASNFAMTLDAALKEAARYPQKPIEKLLDVWTQTHIGHCVMYEQQRLSKPNLHIPAFQFWFKDGIYMQRHLGGNIRQISGGVGTTAYKDDDKFISPLDPKNRVHLR